MKKKNCIVFAELAKELYEEEFSKAYVNYEINYIKNKRENFKSIINLLGIDKKKYEVERKVGKDVKKKPVEYYIPNDEKEIIKLWLREYSTSAYLKMLRKIEKNKYNEHENDKKIEKLKEEFFIEMFSILIKEFYYDPKKIEEKVGAFLNNNQYLYKNMSEAIYRSVCKSIAKPFKDIRGSLQSGVTGSLKDLEKSKYTDGLKYQDPIKWISPMESTALLLIYKQKIEDLLNELNEVSNILSDINIDKADDKDKLGDLKNIIEAINIYEEDCKNKYNVKDKKTYMSKEEIDNLLKGTSFNQRIKNTEINIFIENDEKK